MGKFGGICGETLSELADENVPKIFNSLAESETKNAGKEALEAWTEAVSVVRGIKILSKIVSLQSPIVREEAPPWLNKEIDTHNKEQLSVLVLCGRVMNENRSRCEVNEREGYRENLLLCTRPFMELLLDGGDVRVPAENALTALICSCGADVVMTEENNLKAPSQ